MEDIRPKGAWYAVYLDGDARKACVDVHRVAEALPHGSGLDTDWHITVRRNGDLGLTTEFHVMDEHGSYAGWKTVRASLKRLRKEERHELNTPGFYQILHRAGDIVLRVATSGDLGDYVHDVMSSALQSFFVSTTSHADSFGPNGKPAMFVREDREGGFIGWRETE